MNVIRPPHISRIRSHNQSRVYNVYISRPQIYIQSTHPGWGRGRLEMGGCKGQCGEKSAGLLLSLVDINYA